MIEVINTAASAPSWNHSQMFDMEIVNLERIGDDNDDDDNDESDVALVRGMREDSRATSGRSHTKKSHNR